MIGLNPGLGGIVKFVLHLCKKSFYAAERPPGTNIVGDYLPDFSKFTQRAPSKILLMEGVMKRRLDDSIPSRRRWDPVFR